MRAFVFNPFYYSSNMLLGTKSLNNTICKCLLSKETNMSNFHALEVGRGGETQLQVGENLNHFI